MLKFTIGCATVGLAAAVDMDLTTSTEGARVCMEDITVRQNTDQNVGYVMGWYGETTPFTMPITHDDGTVKSMLWPFVIDHCQAMGPLAGLPKATFTCNSEDEFTMRKFVPTDTDCAGDPYYTATYNSTDLGAPYSFNCANDRTEAYTEFWATVGDNTCTHDKPTFIAVNVCFGTRFPPEMEDAGVATWFCDAEGTQLNIFELGDEMCGDDYLCMISTLEDDTCGMVYMTDSTTIYGKPITCVSQDVDPDDDDSASHLSAMLAAAATIFMAIFL